MFFFWPGKVNAILHGKQGKEIYTEGERLQGKDMKMTESTVDSGRSDIDRKPTDKV